MERKPSRLFERSHGFDQKGQQPAKSIEVPDNKVTLASIIDREGRQGRSVCAPKT
jgi:hypothetical protein